MVEDSDFTFLKFKQIYKKSFFLKKKFIYCSNFTNNRSIYNNIIAINIELIKLPNK